MWKQLALLWLFGACLRLTVLAVPPVIPLIHGSLSLTQAEVGALVSLPVLLFSFAAIPGSLLIARFGAPGVLAAGLLLTAVASALRGASFDTSTLFAATFFMGVGIAVMQPALPAIVRSTLPHRVALGSAAFSNGLLVSEALSSSLTIPYVLPAVGGSWRLSLVFWSVPVLLVALVAWRDALRHPAPVGAARQLAWPDWRSPLTWRLGVLSGGSSSLYFTANAFLPDWLHGIGRQDLVNDALAAINWAQLPASFILLAFSRSLMHQRLPLFLLGLAGSVAILALHGLPQSGIVFWSGVIGFCTAFLLIVTLALPPLLVPAEEVHRTSAAMFAIGYLCALVTPIVGGLLWDLTGRPWAAFAPAAVFGVFIAVATLKPWPAAR